jgi:hypothetical protein
MSTPRTKAAKAAKRTGEKYVMALIRENIRLMGIVEKLQEENDGLRAKKLGYAASFVLAPKAEQEARK